MLFILEKESLSVDLIGDRYSYYIYVYTFQSMHGITWFG